MSRKKITISFVVVAVLAATGLCFTFSRVVDGTRHRGDTEYLQLLKEVITLVKKSYVDDVTDTRLMRGAINGMLASLDPHSSYMPPDSFKEMQITTSGSFGGLGIEITMQDNKLLVISPIEDTPAFKAGIKPGDCIFKIDGKPAGDLSINEAVNRMRGPKGTSVTLTILRKGETKPLECTLVRDVITMKSVRSSFLAPGYGYIRISQFQERTSVDFASALAKLRQENGGTLKGLVLDLRNNPGGLLNQAVGVVDRFVGEGLKDNGLIVYTRGRDESSRSEFYARVGQKEPPYPMVVLINGGSASASEIVAGALQDHKRAVIMGTQSFGKGSVQTIIPIKGNSALLLTTARYYTPNGRSIQAKGITPDIRVDTIEVSTKAKEEFDFHEKDLENHLQAGGSSEKQTPVSAKGITPHENGKPGKNDYQLMRALDLLKGWEALKKITK